MMGAKTFIRTFKEDDKDLISLSDDPKKNTKTWQIPVCGLMDGDRGVLIVRASLRGYLVFQGF